MLLTYVSSARSTTRPVVPSAMQALHLLFELRCALGIQTARDNQYHLTLYLLLLDSHSVIFLHETVAIG